MQPLFAADLDSIHDQYCVAIGWEIFQTCVLGDAERDPADHQKRRGPTQANRNEDTRAEVRKRVKMVKDG